MRIRTIITIFSLFLFVGVFDGQRQSLAASPISRTGDGTTITRAKTPAGTCLAADKLSWASVPISISNPGGAPVDATVETIEVYADLWFASKSMEPIIKIANSLDGQELDQQVTIYNQKVTPKIGDVGWWWKDPEYLGDFFTIRADQPQVITQFSGQPVNQVWEFRVANQCNPVSGGDTSWSYSWGININYVRNAPSTPTGLIATTGPASNEISLVWNPSTGRDTVTGYNIYYREKDTGSFTKVNSNNVMFQTATSAIVSGLEYDTYYDFKVTAHYSDGYQSGYSDPAMAYSGAVPDQDVIEETLQGDDTTDTLGFCQDPSLVGNPIKITNGNKFESHQDLRFITPNKKGFTFSRYYNSRSEQEGSLGYGWTHNYSISIEPYNLNGVDLRKIIDPTGRSIFFEKEKGSTILWTGAFGEKTHVKEESGGLTWYWPDGSRYHFASTGELLWIEDAVGNLQTLNYVGGNLESVTDVASDRTVSFIYIGNRLDHISGPETENVPTGVWVTYGYTNDNLTSVTYADGSGFNYEYTDADPHNLTAKKDKLNHVLATWGYNGDDRAVSSATRDGKGVIIDYNEYNFADASGLIRVTDAYDVTRTYTISEEGGFFPRVSHIDGTACESCSGNVPVHYEYDEDMNITEKWYLNGKKDIYSGFNAWGSPGQVELNVVGGAAERTIHYQYHPNINEVTRKWETSVIPGAGIKETIYNFNHPTTGALTNLVYKITEKGYTRDVNGNIVAHEERITVFTYDEDANGKGLVKTIDGPLPDTADTTIYTYNPVTGDLLSIDHPLPVGAQTQFPQAGYDLAGNPRTMIDINGQSTTYTYDGRNRLLTTAINGISTARSFNTAGDLHTETDSGGRVLTYSYDPTYGRLEKITDMEGNYLSYSYDAKGNRTIDSAYDKDDLMTRWQRFEYQSPGKLWKIINHNDEAIEKVTRFDYDYLANTKTVTDARNRVTDYYYDHFDRMARINQHTQTGDVLTDYTYDIQGNPYDVTDGVNKVTIYEHDDLGRVLSVDSPDSGKTTYTYDMANNTKTVKYPGSVPIVVTYTYDAIYRLTGIVFDNPAENISFTYDLGLNGKGRLTSVIDSSGTTVYTYNDLGQLDLEERTNTGIPIAGVDYQYDPVSYDLSGIVYPSGMNVTYGRDINGRVSSISAGGSPVLQNITFMPFGPVEDYEIGPADPAILKVDRTFNDRYQLRGITAGSVLDYQYEYYDDTSVRKITGKPTPTTINLGATDTYLLSATGKIEKSEGFGSQDGGYQGIIDDIDFIFTYTDDNRLETASKTVKKWENLLEDQVVQAQYEYDASGRRVTKTVDGVTTVFHYDMFNNLIAETDSVGTPLRDYIYLGSEPVAMIVYGGLQAGTYYFINDHLGTPQQLVNGAGEVVWAAAYLPFGEAQVYNEGVVNNLRFPGQYYDAETGLHYNWNRYYDPKTGRYITADPIGLEGGINLYGYVGGNPMNAVDPMGLLFGDRINAEAIMGLNGTVKFSFGGIKATAKADFGSSHYPLGGEEYVSQGGKLSLKPGPITIGIGAERKSAGHPYPSKRDFFNRPIPGTGNSVQDILDGKSWDLLLGIKKGNWALTKVSLELVLLLGVKLEIDFSKDLENLLGWLEDNVPPPCED
ncbi:MAG: RHS domain-containing protein [Proteobacteria bacterium]|nr:RHS domain-containing protein [Pseudomonadota bacterium]MBU1736743.1 RHS domain-containing protein [Pseudomonadota bacterium]